MADLSPEPETEPGGRSLLGQVLIDVYADLSLEVTTRGQVGPPALWAAEGLLRMLANEAWSDQRATLERNRKRIVRLDSLPGRTS